VDRSFLLSSVPRGGKKLYTSYSHKNTIPTNKWGCNYLAQPNRFQACGNCLLSAISSKCMQEDYVCGLAEWRIYPQQELQEQE